MNDKCPNCKSSYIFFNGALCVCTNCQYQWVGISLPEDNTKQRIKEEDKEKQLAGY